MEYVVFDDGKYFGVAYCAGEIADITAYTNGEPTPRGFWFIDKDGNTLSGKGEISMLKGKELEAVVTFDGDTFTGSLNIPFLKKSIPLKNGHRI